MNRFKMILSLCISFFLLSCDEEKEIVCCESYGLGTGGVKCCQTYEFIEKELCVIPDNLEGAGKKIVDDSYCAENKKE